MSKHSSNTNSSLPTRSMELAVSVPEVVAHRLMNFSTAGVSYSPNDYLELYRMWSEKYTVFGESWSAMANEVLRYQQTILASYSRYWFNPWLMPYASQQSVLMSTVGFGEAVIKKGLDPIHRTTIENAKRLGGSHKQRSPSQY